MTDCLLRIRVTPRGSRNEVLGWDGHVLRVKLTAPPVEGAANKACVEFIAHILGLKRSQVALVSGEKSREKTLRIDGVSSQELKSLLAEP